MEKFEKKKYFVIQPQKKPTVPVKEKTDKIKQENEKSEEELFTIIDDLNKKQPEAETKPKETANIIRDIVEKEKGEKWKRR